MKGVFPTTAGKYEVRWREGSRQRSKTFTRERDANSFKREVDRQIELGRPVLLRRDVPTLSSFADEWLERRQVRGEISLNTALFIATLRDKHIDPFIGHLCLLDLTAVRLDQWQSECLATGSPYMTQRASQLLAQILDSAVRKGYLVGGNPARSLERIPHTHAEGIALHPRQVEQIRAWFLSKKRLGDATLISVIAYAGPRTEEAWAMRWRNLRGRRYFVEEKNVDGRLIPDPKTGHRWIDLPEAVVADLAEWRLASGRPEGLIFPKPDGRPWSKSDRGNWRRRWLRKAAEGSAPGITPRDLRHTCASLLAATNTPRVEIENQLGHRADTSERIYQHLIDELRGTKLGVDALIAQARAEVFQEDADVRGAFGIQGG
jgi:integrase